MSYIFRINTVRLYGRADTDTVFRISLKGRFYIIILAKILIYRSLVTIYVQTPSVVSEITSNAFTYVGLIFLIINIIQEDVPL